MNIKDDTVRFWSALIIANMFLVDLLDDFWSKIFVGGWLIIAVIAANRMKKNEH